MLIQKQGITQTQGDARYRRRVDTIAALRALSGSDLQGVYGVAGYSSAGDGAGLPGYFWNSSDGRDDNGGTIIKPTFVTGNGRFNMDHPPGRLHIKWFGGKDDYDGTTWTNNTPFLQALIDYANATFGTAKGCQVDVHGKAYGFNSYVELGTRARFVFVGSGTLDFAGRAACAGSTLVACAPNMDLIRANATADISTVTLDFGGPQFFNVNFLSHDTGIADASNPRYKGRGIVVRALVDCYFSNCTFRELNDGLTLNSEFAGAGGGGGLSGGDASWNNIHHCAFIKNGRYGIYAPYYAGMTVDGDCKFQMDQVGSWGVYITAGPQIKITGNKFDSVPGTAGGVLLGGSGNSVVDNQFEGCPVGVRVTSNSATAPDDGKYNRVIANYFYGNGVTGIDVQSGGGRVSDTTLLGNTYRVFAGTPVSDAGLNTYRLDHLNQGAGAVAGQRCRAKMTAGQSITSNTTTVIAWDAEDIDTNNWHSTVTNNSRVTVAAAGSYLVTAFVEWTNNTNGYRLVQLRKNGTRLTTGDQSASASDTQADGRAPLTVTHQLELAANDYIEVEVNHNSTTTPLALLTSSYLHVTRLA